MTDIRITEDENTPGQRGNFPPRPSPRPDGSSCYGPLRRRRDADDPSIHGHIQHTRHWLPRKNRRRKKRRRRKSKHAPRPTRSCAASSSATRSCTRWICMRAASRSWRGTRCGGCEGEPVYYYFSCNGLIGKGR